MRKNLKRKILLTMLLALLAFPQIVKADPYVGNYVGKETSIRTIIDGEDDETLYSKVYFDKDYTVDVEGLGGLSSYDRQFEYLENINVSPDNPVYKSIDGVLFSKDGKKLIWYPPTKNEGKSYTVPNSVKTIASRAFYQAKITEIKLNNNIEKIDERAFSLSELKEVSMPSKIKKVSEDAFYECTNLQKVNLNNVTNVGPSAFSRCNNLKTVKGNKIKKIGNNAFYQDGKLKTIQLGKVTKIESEAFNECTSLKKVNLSKVKEFGEEAFMYTGIKQFTLKPGVKLAEQSLDPRTKIKYSVPFSKIKPYIGDGKCWNKVIGAKGYQLKLTYKVKKKNKTIVCTQKADYIGRFSKLGKKLKQADYEIFVKIRAYKYKNKKKVYTKWSKSTRFFF